MNLTKETKNIIDNRVLKHMRYSIACETFKENVFESINFKKVKLKFNFEHMSVDQIIEIFRDDANDLIESLYEFDKIKTMYNYSKIIKHVGNVGASTLVFLIWINHKVKNNKY